MVTWPLSSTGPIDLLPYPTRFALYPLIPCRHFLPLFPHNFTVFHFLSQSYIVALSSQSQETVMYACLYMPLCFFAPELF